jgi:hypothetical protein
MFNTLAPPRILFSMYSSHLIRRVNIDGKNLMTVYSASYPRALDYDILLDSDPVYLSTVVILIFIIIGEVMYFG